jgi:hypothetical protein
MHSLTKQRGIGFTGVMFIIIFAGLVGTMAVRLGPVFVENMGVERSVNQMLQQPDFGSMTKNAFYQKLEFKFYTNDVKSFSREETKKMVTLGKNKETGEKEILIKYEHEVPFMRNIFFNVKFEKTIPVTATAAASN